MPARERLILALDVNDPVHALDIVDRFSEWVTTFKVGLELFTSGGFEMMRRTGEAVVETCLKENLPRPKIIAVTVLTSISQDEFKKQLGYQHGIRTQVKHLSAMAHRAGLDGVVASGHEVSAIKNSIGKGFLIITPAIRPSWSLPDDQKRTMTPKEALRNGCADYLVVGRAVLSQKDPQKAIELILLEILSS